MSDQKESNITGEESVLFCNFLVPIYYWCFFWLIVETHCTKVNCHKYCYIDSFIARHFCWEYLQIVPLFLDLLLTQSRTKSRSLVIKRYNYTIDICQDLNGKWEFIETRKVFVDSWFKSLILALTTTNHVLTFQGFWGKPRTHKLIFNALLFKYSRVFAINVRINQQIPDLWRIL